MSRTLRLIAVLTAAALILCGCMFRRQEAESATEISLPEPLKAPRNMIIGEQMGARTTAVTLFFPSAENVSFTTVIRNMRTEAGESLLTAAVNALLSPNTVGGTAFSSTSDTHLLSCEYACGIATVNLSLDARGAQSEQETLSLVAAIGNTLLSIDGVRGVNVLVGGQSARFSQLPLGTQTTPIQSVTTAYAQLQAEKERLNTGSAGISRNVTLYFPATDGTWLLPELREIEFNSDDYASAIVDALKDGPYTNSHAVTAIPEGVDLLEPPRIVTLTSGEHALTLNFSSTLANYLAFSGMEVWQLVGTVALTLNGFLPELDAVRILVNGEPITVCEIGSTIVRFSNGLIRREDFVNRVGSLAKLYLVDPQGALTPVEVAFSRKKALSPRSLLTALFEYAQAAPGEPRLPVPATVSADDLLGIQMEGRIARVNLSADFYRACQLLDAESERGAIYAMVNTLCQLNEIRGVKFLVEGLSADKLSGGVYLRGNLLPNPGIIEDTSVSHEKEE